MTLLCIDNVSELHINNTNAKSVASLKYDQSSTGYVLRLKGRFLI